VESMPRGNVRVIGKERLLRKRGGAEHYAEQADSMDTQTYSTIPCFAIDSRSIFAALGNSL